ncbi:SMI1/KNR4 family protein [Sutcliffiella horikoshii]|uniref:SMI1/KNR4 family protein n=1 Tax=Sutcliffiella horikoshii TaxID=79883 RepID=UPI00384D72C4
MAYEDVSGAEIRVGMTSFGYEEKVLYRYPKFQRPLKVYGKINLKTIKRSKPLTIWKATESDEYKLKPLTVSDIKEVEDRLKVRLPKAYLELLMEQNGGQIVFNAHPSPVPTDWGDSYVQVEYIMGIGKENGILRNSYFLKEWGLPEGLILFNGDGHSWLAFDYRKVQSNPEIVYVESDSGKLVILASSFEEFLANLYIEEAEEFDFDDSYEFKDYSQEEFERLLEKNESEELVIALSTLSQGDVDEEWLGKQLVLLSKHLDPYIRSEVAGNVWNYLTYRLDEDTLLQLIETFRADTDSDIQMLGEMIVEKLNYSYDQLKEDIHLTGMVSFSLNGSIYHLNNHTGQWHLSDSERDLQSFGTVEELLDRAVIEGKSLEQIWNEVKIL